jgi:hypothetical protein
VENVRAGTVTFVGLVRPERSIFSSSSAYVAPAHVTRSVIENGTKYTIADVSNLLMNFTQELSHDLFSGHAYKTLTRHSVDL